MQTILLLTGFTTITILARRGQIKKQGLVGFPTSCQH
jgi:hypothetical protein